MPTYSRTADRVDARGIRVKSIQPGPIKTDMSAHLYVVPHLYVVARVEE